VIKTLEELLNLPDVKQHISEENSKRIENHLAGKSEASSIQRALQGIGAWLSAIFFLGFLGVSGLLRSDASMLTLGVILLGASVGLERGLQSTFVTQLALALAIAGNCLAVVGFTELTDADLGTGILAHGVIGSVAYVFHTNSTYRFLAAAMLSLFAQVWILESSSKFWMFHIYVAVHVALIGWLFFRGTDRTELRPLATAAVIMLPYSMVVLAWRQSWSYRTLEIEHLLLPSNAIIVIGLALLLRHVVREQGWFRRRSNQVVLLGLIALGVFTTPGVLVAIGLLALGRACSIGWVTALAHAFLVAFIFQYYHSLDIDLAYKSLVLAGSGLLLLVVRRFLVTKAGPHNSS